MYFLKLNQWLPIFLACDPLETQIIQYLITAGLIKAILSSNHLKFRLRSN